ncbi:MAG: hypothetical protein ACRDLD_07520, partial [Thermoleophilaceae bacterium]
MNRSVAGVIAALIAVLAAIGLVTGEEDGGAPASAAEPEVQLEEVARRVERVREQGLVFPYARGAVLVNGIEARGGWEAVDRALRSRLELWRVPGQGELLVAGWAWDSARDADEFEDAATRRLAELPGPGAVEAGEDVVVVARGFSFTAGGGGAVRPPPSPSRPPPARPLAPPLAPSAAPCWPGRRPGRATRAAAPRRAAPRSGPRAPRAPGGPPRADVRRRGQS